MRLHIPKSVPFDESEPDGEHQMTMQDWCTLKRIMQGYDSFEHLEGYIKKGHLDQRHKLRHVDLLEWVEEDRWPKGGLRDSFVAVLNTFGDMTKGDIVPSGLPFDVVCSKAADDLNITERAFKPKLNSLIKAKHLDLSYGNVLFPAVRSDDQDKKA